MNKKRQLLVLPLIFCLSSVFAEKVLLADFFVLDEQGKSIDVNEKNIDAYYSVFKSAFYEENIFYERTKKYGKTASFSDAMKICRAEEGQLLVYGYVQKKDSCWFSEFKLLDLQKETIVADFYAAETHENLENLLKLQANKIEKKVRQLMGFETAEIEKPLFPFSVYVPLNVFYWTPVDKAWCRVLTGMAGIESGICFFPENWGVVLKNRECRFGEKVSFEYKAGMGNPQFYKAFWNSFMAKNLFICDWFFEKDKSVYAGAGPFFEFDVVDVEKKYEKSSVHVQRSFGVVFETGVHFFVNEKVLFNTGVELNIPFESKSFLTAKPKAGLVWKGGGK